MLEMPTVQINHGLSLVGFILEIQGVILGVPNGVILLADFGNLKSMSETLSRKTTSHMTAMSLSS